MTTLREAARQALEALENGNRVRAGEGGTKCQISLEGSAITALRAALAEPVQEPVQEPVAWRFKAMIGSPWSLSDDGYYISCKRDQRYFVEALYTAPPQRKPLTEEEIQECFYAARNAKLGSVVVEIARAIERAHGIGEQP